RPPVRSAQRSCAQRRSSTTAAGPDHSSVAAFHRHFFFSSRRRHTRFSRDWSSDVCSSDLVYRCTNWTESSAVLDAMINQHSEHGYKTVELDPLNALQTQLKDEIIRRQESTQPAARSNNSMGDRGMLQADWDVVWMRMRKIMEAFHAAPFHTIWTAHADTVQDSMTGKMAMAPLFQGTKTKNEATRIPGIVGYIRMVEHNGETVPGVQFAGGAGVLAGDRYRKLGKGMANPTMADIYNKIFS